MLWWKLQQLRSTDWKVRSQAAEKLGATGDPRATDALVKALKDKDRNVREAAALALGQIGDSKAVEPLLATLKDYDRSVRRSAAQALGMIRDERVIERLLPMLRDPDGDIRAAVARALEIVGGAGLNDRQRAAIAVARMKWDEAASIGTPAVEPLLESLGVAKGQVRIATVQCLERIGDTRAIEPLIGLLRDADSAVQEAAAWALAAVGDVRAPRPLVALAYEGLVASAAVSALARLVERILPSIPDDDLTELTFLQHEAEKKHAEQKAKMSAHARATASTQPLDFSSVSQLAHQELIRRGRPAGPPIERISS